MSASEFEEKIDWVRLNLINGLGPRLRRELLTQFQSPTAILQASKNELMVVPGIGNHLAESIVHSHNRLEAVAELEKSRRHGFEVLAEYEQRYPKSLLQIPDPPGVLSMHGELLETDCLAIAIVGTRHASRYGLAQTQKLAFGLAQAGFTIVSGLARGVDTAAHEAALDSGGRTIAVLGSGLLQLYPPENKNLAARIAESGAVLSEYGIEHKPKSSTFPQRNRIITGLSLGAIVIEASQRSGALISARHAVEQDREVFAVPGRVDSRTSTGCHALIREGAKLVECIDDVIEELGPLAERVTNEAGQEVQHPAELQLNEQEKAVLGAVDDDTVSIDSIVHRTKLPVSRVLSTLSVLEMKRLIHRVSGTRVSRS